MSNPEDLTLIDNLRFLLAARDESIKSLEESTRIVVEAKEATIGAANMKIAKLEQQLEESRKDSNSKAVKDLRQRVHKKTQELEERDKTIRENLKLIHALRGEAPIEVQALPEIMHR